MEMYRISEELLDRHRIKTQLMGWVGATYACSICDSGTLESRRTYIFLVGVDRKDILVESPYVLYLHVSWRLVLYEK